MTFPTTTPGQAAVVLSDGSLGLQTIPTVDGVEVSSSNPLPVSLGGGSISLSANLAKANAAAPALAEGATAPLSVDLAGNLRVAGKTGVQIAGSDASISNPVPTAATDGALVTIGTTSDAAYASGSGTAISILKGIFARLASLVSTSAGTAQRIVLVDPVTGNGSLVQAFHNADNQVIGSTSYGLMTGGVDQLINAAGNLDRKRAVAGDGVAGTGLAAEVPLLWNGTSYDRAPGSAATGLKVQASARPPFSGSASFTRPATTPNFTTGTLIANSATNTSVVPLAFNIGVAAGILRTAWLLASNPGVLGQTVRLHLYSAAPTPANGDASAWSTPSTGYIGALDVTFDRTFSDGVYGRVDSAELAFALSTGTTLYGLAEARSSWTGVASSTLAAGLVGYPN